jgi:hypothetical protein
VTFSACFVVVALWLSLCIQTSHLLNEKHAMHVLKKDLSSQQKKLIDKICIVQNVYRIKSTARKHLFHDRKI